MQQSFLVNGHREGCISPFDRGYAYGDGVFRTLPVYAGVPHCWDLHYRKLCEDCKALGIVCPPEDILADDISALIGEDEDATIKIVITRGESVRGYAVPALAQPTRVVIRTPAASYPPEFSSDGVKLFVCDTRLSSQPRLAGVKHLNRLENVLARMEWVDPQLSEGLMLDADGQVIEGTMSNVFIRNGSHLKTPDLSRCGVAGVTRERIIRMAPQLGYQIEIADLSLEQVLAADEVIICNSLFGAWQVRELHHQTWACGELAALLRNNLSLDDTLPA